MSSSDLRDRMDGLQWDVCGSVTKLETIMPGSSIITYSRGENVSRDQEELEGGRNRFFYLRIELPFF